MSGRDYDLLIVGATGLTGKLVVEQIAQRDDLLRDSSGRRPRTAAPGKLASTGKAIPAISQLPQ